MNTRKDLDIIELLRAEHEDLRELFTDVLGAEPQARTAPFRQLASRLVAREAAERRLAETFRILRNGARHGPTRRRRNAPRCGR